MRTREQEEGRRRRNRRYEVIDVEQDKTPADKRVVKIDLEEEEMKTQVATGRYGLIKAKTI